MDGVSGAAVAGAVSPGSARGGAGVAADLLAAAALLVRPNRPACTPPPRSTSTEPWAPGSRHSRGLRGRPAHRGRAEGTARTVTGTACVVALSFRSPGRHQSGCSPSAGRRPPLSLRSCAAGRRQQRRLLVEDPRWPSTTCSPAASGNAGRVRGTSSCTLVPHRRPSDKAESSGTATRAPTRCTSPGLLLPGGAELHRHEAARPEHRGDLRHNHRYHIINVVPTAPPWHLRDLAIRAQS